MVSKKKRSSPKLRLIFRPNSEIQTFFQTKNRWSPKKNRSSPKLRLIFRPNSEIQTFFQTKNRWSPKKKRSSSKLRLIFRPTSEILTLFLTESRHVLHNFGSQFPLGGAVFNFSPKIALKSTNNVRFCVLH